jgi:hypothetical protein
MKSIFFQFFPVSLSIFIAILIGYSCSKTTGTSHDTENRNYKEMKFRFEDYDAESPKIVQEKLDQLFPKGSSLSEFQSAMNQLGIECRFSNEPRDKEVSDVVYCQYQIETGPFRKTQWTVVVKTKDSININELKVTVGYIGL